VKSLRIYFGDLTHDSIGLATEVFPLNIGFVAAYCKGRFGDAVEMQLFKYIGELEDAIETDPPDILALSNYPWCHNVDMAMLRQCAARRPEALRFMGGPNFPHAPAEQQEFLAARPLIDAYAYLDGEVPFANFVELVLGSENLAEAREKLKSVPVAGCVHLDHDGRLVAVPANVRLRNLDEVPSPYLLGLMDKFFDGRLSPMIQTNRGCPFTCTFCADGHSNVNKVNAFSVERVRAELNYIGERVPANIKTLFVSDLNFGMYKRDAEISASLAGLRERYDYPTQIITTTGKNSKERVIRNIEQLAGALELSMSVQSLTPHVLRHIKRDNLRLDDFLALKPAIERVGLPTQAEVILGLPGETKESHIETLDKLLSMELDELSPYTLMMLNGTELNTPEQREKWKYKTKFRVIPRDFTRLKSGENVVEAEEVAVETSTLPFADYIYCRKFVLVTVVTSNGFRPLIRLLLQNHLPVKDLMTRMLDALERAPGGRGNAPPGNLALFMREFERETREELWDSEQEMVAFFQDRKNFQGLLEGVYGANLLQTYKARIWGRCFDELTGSAFAHAGDILREAGASGEVLEQLEQVELFCRGCTFNMMGEDRLDTVPEAALHYDIASWMGDSLSRPLRDFAWSRPRVVRFTLSAKQFQHLEDNLEHFGRTDLGRGRALTRIPVDALWRSPVACDEFSTDAAWSRNRILLSRPHVS